MSVQAVTHINFNGQARAALSFYHAVFGGRIMLVTYQDFGVESDGTPWDAIIWGQVVAESGMRIMAYDVQKDKAWHPGENAFYVSLRGDSAEEIAALWERLVEGGNIVHPLAPAKWSLLYGMLKDRFGVTWVLDVAPDAAR
ncbi:VOC family protein [Massilia sp. YIM B02443]|uniref:VOC family protein n=1 Tax=Massilia sp. YIM B02443 TaxID=3050127 RepID=UPI0025B6FED9|nr:VOC family protein [Massilia sp. YIM B02443]MDN4036917.1 VOC family protein [Massilia sp. YIM B02443]